MKKSIYSLLIGAAILTSCSKTGGDPVDENPAPGEEDVEDVVVDVTTSGGAINAGGSQLFTFSGEINKVEFYSGEPGHVYEYRDRTERELEGEVNMSFVARVMNTYSDIDRELDFFISTDFSGEYTTEAIAAATWKSFSDKVTFPVDNADGPANDGRVENTVDIADLMEQGKPFHVGFRYIAPQRPQSSRNGRQWRIGFYSLTHEFSGQTVSLSHYEMEDWATTAWTFVTTEGEVESGRGGSMVTADGRALNFTGNITSPNDGFQLWGISTAHDIYTVEPDQGVTIETPSDQYSHVYAAPGTYDATFVLHSPDSAEPVVKKVEVTVVP